MAEFDRFLHAPIGIEQNGMALSVLTVLARQDLDPWEAARQLSSLAREPATRSLAAILGRMPAASPLADVSALASRLVALLPAPGAPVRGKAANPTVPAADPAPTAAHRLRVIIGLTLLMLTMRWMLAGMSAPEPGVSQPPPPAQVARKTVSDRTELTPARE